MHVQLNFRVGEIKSSKSKAELYILKYNVILGSE